jgi:hypothetical protein
MQANIVDVPALAGDEALVFLAQRAGANSLDSHSSLSLSECYRAASIEYGDLIFLK